MSLIHWQPLKEFETLRHQMDHLFDELIHNDRESSRFPKLENAIWAPAIELKEADTKLILKAEIPGVDSKDLDIHVSENAVSISGKHEEEKHSETEGYFHSELRRGQFQRTVLLPKPVKYNEACAEYVDGLLTLTLPKAESSTPKVAKVDLKVPEKAPVAITEQPQPDQQSEEKVLADAEDAVSQPPTL